MTVDIDQRGAVRIVTINRPERRNALDPETFAGVGRAFAEAETDDAVRVMVITGAGDRAFCSGMDLKAFAAGAAMLHQGGPGIDVFTERRYPKPVIAAVNGAAVGGGFGMMLACDLIVAADHAVFGLPEVKRGLVGAGASAKAALRLPPAIALELALTGETIDAARALHLGIVNRVVAGRDVLATTVALAETIAANGPIAVAASKEVVYLVAGLDTIDMPRIRAMTAHVSKTADAAEGARAFAEKRPPRFTGR